MNHEDENENECRYCGNSQCDGLVNCECGEDMRCTESLCRRCKAQQRDDECEYEYGTSAFMY